MAKSHLVTIPDIINTAWGVLLQRYNNNDDVVFGVTVSGRPSEISGVEDIVGLFINTVPVRIRKYKDQKMIELIKETNLNSIKRKIYENTPLVEIKSQSELDAKSDFFDSIMVIENYPLDKALIEINSPLQISAFEVFEVTNYDLTIVVTLFKGTNIKFIYNEELFNDKVIDRLGKIFEKILYEFAHNPEQRISEVNLLSLEEKEMLLDTFNHTEVDYPKEKTIIDLFSEQVKVMPDSMAVLFKDESITYQELDERSNHLVQLLREKGVTLKAETIVGIMVEPSIEMVIGIFGILKAGGAYLPIDSKNPIERIQYMLSDSGVEVLLTQSKFIKMIDDCDKLEIICLDSVQSSKELCSIYLPTPTNLAYVIYTSGSTGKPKGVLVEHLGLTNLLVAMQRDYPIMPEDTWLLKTPYTFDVSLTEMFGWILGGGRLAILEPEAEKDPGRIILAIDKYDVTHLNFVPSMYNVFMDYVETFGVDVIDKLKYLMVAGEAISKEQVKRLYRLSRSVKFVNLYGPTEATIYATKFALDNVDQYSTVPIGSGIANTQLYILDKNNNLQPVGFPGQLCIAGDGLARGYINLPELTAERFTPNPYGPSGRIYKTGDLARWLPDGNIEFLGRIDHQVKIRGYRIEIGEVENKLLSHPLVKEAVVIERIDQNGLKYLCGYLVIKSMIDSDVYEETNISKIREDLAVALPDYMIPTHFVVLDKLPLLLNGKLNRKALPEPQGMKNNDVEYVAPRNEIETKLVLIWLDVLGVEKIGVFDNFFDLGGHSLKAVRTVAKIYKEFNVEVTVKDLYNSPTINELVRVILEAEKSIYSEIKIQPRQKYYPLSSAQKRLYLLTQLEPLNTVYNMPIAIEIKGKLDKDRFKETLKKLISRHDAFRTCFELVDGKTVQVIKDDVDFEPEIDEINQANVECLDVDKVMSDFVKPFDLTNAPLLRASLSKINTESYLLLLDMHHIISDGLSLEVIIADFTRLYSNKALAPLQIQYRDFAVWQNNIFDDERIKKQEEYWLNEFSDDLPSLNLPTDYVSTRVGEATGVAKRPAIQSFEGNSIDIKLDKELADSLRGFAEKNGVTLYMLLFALYNLLLSKSSGQEDMIVGTPVAGRPHPDLQNIIGMFVNTLALRSKPEGEKSFSEYLAEVRGKVLLALDNQDFQFEMLIDKLNLERDLSRNPLFDVMFVLQNTQNQLQIPDLKLNYLQTKTSIAKFDLTLTAVEINEGLIFSFEYSTKLFKQERIERMAAHFVNIITEVVKNLAQRIMDI